MRTPGLTRHPSLLWRRQPVAIMLNFVWMSCCFAVNHGTATVLISIASSEFTGGLGGYSTGVLSVAFFPSPPAAAPGGCVAARARTYIRAGALLGCRDAPCS